MEIVSMILLAVIVFAMIAMFVLFFLEKRRSNQRYMAMLQYVDRSAESVDTNCIDATKELIDQYAKKIMDDILHSVNQTISEKDVKIQEQLNTLLLDYSQAQAAADRINDFGASLANIFDYDPVKAIQKGRKKEV